MEVLIVSEKKQILKHLSEILEEKAIKINNIFSLFDVIDKIGTKDIVVCLDVSSIQGDQVEVVKNILDLYPWLRILALSQDPNLIEGSKLLEAGVRGYVNSRLYDTHLKDAIRTISLGSVWIYPDFIYSMVKIVSQKNNNANANFDKLTLKEREVAKLVLDGLSNKQIAQALSISERTAKAHLTSIYSKMGVKDRLGFVLAMENSSEKS